jgi:cysteine desulfurase
MEHKFTYLDHNATTPLRKNALEAMTAILSEVGNPSSIHAYGRSARKSVEDARKKIADTLDVSSGQVFFNSGATEGNNTIIKGFAGKRILISATEHPSVIDAGVKCDLIPVNSDGVIDLTAFEKQVKENPPALISVMLVNNETGVIQPVADISKIAKSVGALVHCDAVQAYGRLNFTRESLGVDFLTLSSHKIGGPQGVGALIMSAGTTLPKLLEGGGQERRSRAGTENTAGIAGFGVAAVEAVADIPKFEKLAVFRERIETEISKSSRVKIYGQNAPRVANTICCTINGIASDTLLMAFDIEGIAISSGSACSSGTVKISHVLKAMGFDGKQTAAALRISLGHTTTEQDIEKFISVWNILRTRLLKD